jgi:uroporphyrin-III C-methyltransferase
MPLTQIEQLVINKQAFQHGEVALVGAGPGDPDLLTIQALRFIQQADVVIYDRLVSDAIMSLIPEHCERVYVGKKQADHRVPQHKINQMLVEYAKQGLRVLRLKGGDPFVFGRGGEEALYLQQSQVPCHIVPGLTAASACTSYAGIPLTHRELAQSCTFITGHTQQDGALELPWHILNEPKQTVVFYMGVKSLPIIVKQLQQAGRPANTPAALIRKGTQPEQQVIRGNLHTIMQLVREHNITPPTLIIIGEVVNVFDQTSLKNVGYLA